MCWRLKGPSGRAFQCGIYAIDAPGVEVRVRYSDSEEALLNSQVVANVARGRELAERWRVGIVAKGSFEELTMNDDITRWERQHQNGWFSTVERTADGSFNANAFERGVVNPQWAHRDILDFDLAKQMADEKVPPHDCSRCPGWLPQRP